MERKFGGKLAALVIQETAGGGWGHTGCETCEKWSYLVGARNRFC